MNPQAYAELSQTLDQRESIVAALTKLDEVLLSVKHKLSICADVKSLCIQFTRRWWRKIRKSRRSWTFAPFASSSLTVKRMRNLSDCAERRSTWRTLSFSRWRVEARITSQTQSKTVTNRFTRSSGIKMTTRLRSKC